MNAKDRQKLTQTLAAHVAKVAAELRQQLQVPGVARERARKLHLEEQVGDDFEVWTDLLARRAAVIWVLKSVYVRVLEDRGLLQPGRLLDGEAQQLFEKLAPNLGETAFLRWVYHDLASPRGGLPELFAPQPAEVVEPSDALSRQLLELWRRADPETGARWSFAQEYFAGELMGDLYQELDPVVKDRYALCQTPDFVRAFMLDQTLTPALAAFGADQVRVIDPACGSGHFLLDAFRRLVDATGAQHEDWPKRKVVEHVLGRLVGIDLNDYACALARARLVMTAAELSGEVLGGSRAGSGSLGGASRFHPHIYWADGLEQVEKRAGPKEEQLRLGQVVTEEPARAVLTRPEIRAELGPLLGKKFQVVVANPPYITERDPARKLYHREKTGKSQRYVSAYREYSLASPFVERSLQLATPGGYVGLIVSNNFMKREFGKPLIEQVLSGVDLSLVVDSSQAYIPFHGTPTVLIFARNRPPVGETVRAVMGKRGETGVPENPADGRVWSSIVQGWDQVGFENEYVSVAAVPRGTFKKHPWSLGGGGAAELRAELETNRDKLLDRIESIGFMCITKQDDVFVHELSVVRRLGMEDSNVRAFGLGDNLRDWSDQGNMVAIFPYRPDISLCQIECVPKIHSFMWRYRSILENRAVFGGDTFRSAGKAWWEYGQIPTHRFRTPLSIAFAFVATHNHFVLDRGGKVFNRSAPVIKLPAGSSEEDHLALLGVLNSSTLGFWMRQVFHAKGGESSGTKIQSEVWARRHEYDATKLQMAPIPEPYRERVIALARKLDGLATETQSCMPRSILASAWTPDNLKSVIAEAGHRIQTIRDEAVGWQEELDWTVYAAFGLVREYELTPIEHIEPLKSEHRPFAIRLARSAAQGEASHYWFEAHEVIPALNVPAELSPAQQHRIARRLTLIEDSPALGLVEAAEYKRRWEPVHWQAEFEAAATEWLTDRVEVALQRRGKPATCEHLVAALQDDARFLALLTQLQARPDPDIRSQIASVLDSNHVPNHPYHIYTESGAAKRAAWEQTWALQRREDAGEALEKPIPVPPEYSQGSRGKSTDYLRNEYWRLRGKLDVPKERFIAYTEVPGVEGEETLYGWAGWTPLERLRVLLELDEKLEDAGYGVSDRLGVLDSAWRLLPDVAREDPGVAARLKAELQALVGLEGPSAAMLEAWKGQFPAPGKGGKRKR